MSVYAGFIDPVPIRREPFARADLMRYLIPKDDRGECAWCGQPARFHYQWEQDGSFYNNPPWGATVRLQFCSVGCFEDY